MTINEIITAAITYGPGYIGGLPSTKVDIAIARAADAAGRNVGTFLADLEEMFPEEVGAILG